MRGTKSKGGTDKRLNASTAASSTDTSENGTVLSTKEAFRPRSGYFGWMVCPVAQVVLETKTLAAEAGTTGSE
jgi:hypothetical protein